MISFFKDFCTISYDYSKCQKYESSPVFVKNLEIRLHPGFLSTCMGNMHNLSSNMYIRI